jgi:hypothetical protein
VTRGLRHDLVLARVDGDLRADDGRGQDLAVLAEGDAQHGRFIVSVSFGRRGESAASCAVIISSMARLRSSPTVSRFRTCARLYVDHAAASFFRCSWQRAMLSRVLAAW